MSRDRRNPNAGEFRFSKKIKRLFELLARAGAKDCMFVGGCVRDHLLGVPSKDVDIEVYGLDYEAIVAALEPFFRVDLVGRSFGVVKVGYDIDVSIPRRESKTGIGHTAFHVRTDSDLTPREAFGRRDFTINAIGMRPDGSFCDPYGGREDLRRNILRATTEAFCEDPLRVLRGMQLAARFGLETDEKTLELSRRVLPEFESLAHERVWGEWAKWAEKGRFPSKGLRFLSRCGWLEKFPEIAALARRGALERTMAVCDAAAEIAWERNLDARMRTEILLAALSHDFAGENGRAAAAFLQRMSAPKRIGERVVPVVREREVHLAANDADAGGNTDAARRNGGDERLIRRLAVRVSPGTIRLWGVLCTAIARAKNADRVRATAVGEEEILVQKWVRLAEDMSLADAPPEPILRGRDLIPLGFVPGKALGKILEEAFELQLDGHLRNLREAILWARRDRSR